MRVKRFGHRRRVGGEANNTIPTFAGLDLIWRISAHEMLSLAMSDLSPIIIRIITTFPALIQQGKDAKNAIKKPSNHAGLKTVQSTKLE